MDEGNDNIGPVTKIILCVLAIVIVIIDLSVSVKSAMDKIFALVLMAGLIVVIFFIAKQAKKQKTPNSHG